MGERQDLASIFPTSFVTHNGCLRLHNEDSVLARPEIGLWAVADGMGGHDSGAYASQTVIEALSRIPEAEPRLLLSACHEAIREANAEIRRVAQSRCVTIGTTLALVIVDEKQVACLWCGDSRIYRIRSGAISLLSRDHTELQDLLDRGVLTESEGRNWPNRNVLTHALGVFEEPPTETTTHSLEEDDVFVICSDGLTAHVGEDDILACAGRRSPRGGCQALLDLALSRGGRDNVTVVLIQYRPNATRRSPSPQSPAA